MDERRITIRRATSRDAALLAELGARTFRDAFGAQNTESDMAAYLASAFGVDIQARELADMDSVFLIAHAGDEVAGYAHMRAGVAPACVSGARPIEIVRFYSVSEWLGRGVGVALMGACIAEATARGADVVWLSVWQENVRAVAFYSKRGFSVVGDKDFVVGRDLQRDHVMVLRLVPDAG